MSDSRSPPGVRSRARFFSLKWKVLLTLGAVMLAANGILSWLHFHDLQARFEAQRTETRQRLVNQAFALRDDFGQRLQGLAGMLAALDSVGVGLFETPTGHAPLLEHFDAYWAALQFGLGIDSLQVYARTGPPLASWPGDGQADLEHEEQVRRVMATEHAIHWTRCRAVCTEYAAAPVLSAGRVAGAIVLGSSPADVVDAQAISGADLGVLIPSPRSAANRPGDEELLLGVGWRVIELSSKGKDRPLLHQLTSVPAVTSPRAHATISLPYDGRYFELSFLALTVPEGAEPPSMMVVIDDLTDARAAIGKSVWDRLMSELLTSLLSLALLALLVHAPATTQAVLAIPLLGRGAFAQARARIALRTRRVFDDEIDSLDEAAIALSYRLETLETDVAAHLRKLSVERDFKQNLLETAQVIILTQSAEGQILTLNQYGRSLSGWDEQDLPGRFFFELLGPEGSSPQPAIRPALWDLALGQRQHVQMESILQGVTGQSYEITWNHSRLAGHPGDMVMILSVGIDHTERKHAESHANYLDEHDPLTGLVNRRHFQHELGQALASAHRSGYDGALLYLDLDEFRLVNDVSGHQARRYPVRTSRGTMSSVARASNLLGRLGGDELGLLLHECDREAHQITEINKQPRRNQVAGTAGKPSGLHQHRNRDFLRRKHGRRATPRQHRHTRCTRQRTRDVLPGISTPEGEGVQQKMQERLHWKEMISKSLVDERFVVHYQPIQDIRARQVSHYEALVRMQAPDGSVIAPGVFMEAAEQRFDPPDIDRYVIKRVFRKMLGLFAAGKYYKFSINLSGVGVNDASLLPFLREALSCSPMLPGHVVFEITETAAVSDFSAARLFMESVRELRAASFPRRFRRRILIVQLHQAVASGLRQDRRIVRATTSSITRMTRFSYGRWPRWHEASARRQ